MKIAAFFACALVAISVGLAYAASADEVLFSCDLPAPTPQGNTISVGVVGFTFGAGQAATAMNERYNPGGNGQPLIVQTRDARAFATFLRLVNNGQHIKTCTLSVLPVAANAMAARQQRRDFRFNNLETSAVRWVYNMGTNPTMTSVVELTFNYTDLLVPSSALTPAQVLPGATYNLKANPVATP
jgi:hypothetical protein